PECLSALTELEGPLVENCADGLDNDGDGWPDAADPDCVWGTAEVGYGWTQCNDGVDNDGDRMIDGDDRQCTSAWIDSEAGTIGNCNDGLDNDGDGWADAADPDCRRGNAEVGLSQRACNDGWDNDGDGLIDALDPQCLEGWDNNETR
ncbi:MAG: hypothetical protein JXR83_12490, partial [Deltaproteobacteria bacterium]|nr:hypothetical protein [Deltaproteobacteria bacterium]